MSGLKRAALIFALCIAASILCAWVMIIALNFSDGAHREPFQRLLSDRDFSWGGEITGVMFGIISFPFVYLATRKRRLAKVAPAILAIVLSEICLVTPFAGSYNLPGAVATLVFALFLCVGGWLG